MRADGGHGRSAIGGRGGESRRGMMTEAVVMVIVCCFVRVRRAWFSSMCILIFLQSEILS